MLRSPCMTKIKQAVGNHFTAKSLTANQPKILAEILKRLRVVKDAFLNARFESLGTGRNRCQGIIYFMDHASCESAYCCELLRASHRTIGFDAGANILPNGNYVRHFPASIDPHWNFADQPMINSPVWRCSFLLDALN